MTTEMEYIRMKVSDGDINASQIMTQSEFQQYMNMQNIWEKCESGLSISFSKVKKSPLLKSN